MPSWANGGPSAPSGNPSVVDELFAFQKDLKDVVEASTQWGFEAGLGIMSAQALYILVLYIIRSDK